jgi:lipopolysaccharide/colanic/teichoic acid biosynthesis glycosyltransferase/ubiquinone/menaquinone biosynthesis C-methylase UbiE
MDLPLLLGAFMLTLLLCAAAGRGAGSRRARSPRARSAAWRTAFLASTALMLALWAWAYAMGSVAAWSAATVVLGCFLGGVTATAGAVGIAENHTAPSPDVREKILAFHRDEDLRYPPEPTGKRLFDVVVASLGIIATLPLWLLVAMVVWIEDPGPLFFVKHSVGRGGVTFPQLKFRSMQYQAEVLTGPVISIPDDPRVLRAGRWLRRWHLDELTELLNVLQGSMSLVGPRPLRSVLVQLYLEEVPGYAQRHTVRPGIACIAQIERYRLTPAERLRKDKAYIRRMGLGMDLMLLARAVTTTVRGQRDRKERTRVRVPTDRGEAPPAPDQAMPSGAKEFYLDVLRELLRTGVLHRDMEILVVCGGAVDRAVLAACRFRRVVISNIDASVATIDFAPFTWSYQDAERLTYPAESFDFCLVHSGLHHCHSPHRALLEMYRVSRVGLLLFEPYDNLLTRLGVRLGFGQEYEHAAVVSNKYDHGGVANTAIPNYVYRWTQKEIVKTVQTFAPYARHDIRFIHKMRIPWTQLRKRRDRSLYHIVRLAQPALKLLETCAPRQSNNFAAVVFKPNLPQALHPWLRDDGGAGIALNGAWLASRYGGVQGRLRDPGGTPP